MSSVMSGYRRSGGDHFEPDLDLDPHAQRQLRAKLEQIDFTAHVSNREMIGHTLRRTDAKAFQRLGVATAQARALWVSAALSATESGRPPTAAQIDELTRLRRAYEELAEAYDALRRMVERGYLAYTTPEKLG